MTLIRENNNKFGESGTAMGRAISLGLVLCLFLFRPAALGQNYAALGLAAVIGLTIFATLNASIAGKKWRIDRDIGRDVAALLVLISAYLIYQTAIAFAFGLSNLEFHLKDSVLAVAAAACYGVFLFSKQNNVMFFRQFTSVVAILGWSGGATLVGAYFWGLEELRVLDFRMTGYEHIGGEVVAGTVYLPMSMAYGVFTGADIVLLRFTGFFREPGIYQAIAAYCLVLAAVNGRAWWVYLGLVIGIVITFSTLGIAMLLISCGIAYFLKHRATTANAVLAMGLAFGGLVASLYTPAIGILDKFETHGISISDRTDAMLSGFERAMENPLGEGPFSAKEPNENITLIASAGAIGLLGIAIQVLILSGLRGRFNRQTILRAGVCAPLLLTALFSQPIAGATMIYVLVMVYVHEAKWIRPQSRWAVSGAEELHHRSALQNAP